MARGRDARGSLDSWTSLEILGVPRFACAYGSEYSHMYVCGNVYQVYIYKCEHLYSCLCADTCAQVLKHACMYTWVYGYTCVHVCVECSSIYISMVVCVCVCACGCVTCVSGCCSPYFCPCMFTCVSSHAGLCVLLMDPAGPSLGPGTGCLSRWVVTSQRYELWPLLEAGPLGRDDTIFLGALVWREEELYHLPVPPLSRCAKDMAGTSLHPFLSEAQLRASLSSGGRTKFQMCSGFEQCGGGPWIRACLLGLPPL